jgi:hypothetical protein
MTATGGEAAPAAGGPGQPSNGAAKRRGDLASELEGLAEELEEKSSELNRIDPGPEDDPDLESLWRAGLVVMRGYVDRVDRIQADCLRAVNEEPQASGTVDTAREPLNQLGKAVVGAIVVINAAVHSLQRPDQPFMLLTRSMCFRDAADQLSELAQRCRGLVVHMGGKKGLGGNPPNPA